MAKKDKRQRLLRDLRQKKHACTAGLAEQALKGWGFDPGRVKGHTQVWMYRSITLTLHKPHQKHMDPGAVAEVIRAIEEARFLQEQERTTRQNPWEEDEGD